MPTILIIAGPNGAGKTTFANALFEKQGAPGPFLNADEIARERALAGLIGGERDIRAGRLLLERMDALLARGEGFVFETTLSSRLYARRIPEWRRQGYRVELNYVRLPTAMKSVERVAHRVARGGHGVPEADLLRRFGRSLDNLERIYKPVVDAWQVWESRAGEFILVEWSAP